MTSQAYIHRLSPPFHAILVNLTSSGDPTTLLRSLGHWVKALLGNVLEILHQEIDIHGNLKLSCFHHHTMWWLIKSECENWNSLTFLWTNKWWLHKYCSENMKLSELVLLNPRHTAVHTGNSCGMRSLWEEPRPSAHPRSSPRSGSARRSEGSLCIRITVWGSAGHCCLTARQQCYILRKAGPALWAHNLYSLTWPHAKHAGFHALLSPSGNLLTKDTHFYFARSSQIMQAALIKRQHTSG